MTLPHVLKKLRCVTRKCGALSAIDAAAIIASVDGYWQFQCPSCKYWNLVSPSDTVQATAPAPFELERLPTSVRSSSQVKRSPPGGV